MTNPPAPGWQTLRPQRVPNTHLDDPFIRLLIDFFQTKGLPAIKSEDAAEHWHADWIEYQSKNRLYASLLSPSRLSTLGSQFDLLRLTRFLETFACFSPAHGYSLQCTFLGLFPILMGANESLKIEAIAKLEAGQLFAFGISEKNHGSDLFGNEFVISEIAPGRLTATGQKYYIGNSNVAGMISILARKVDARHPPDSKRAPFVMFAIRPKDAPAFRDNRKIRTSGIRSAFVGQFDVRDHPLPHCDIIAEGRGAWDAMFATVSLGKFFLGFGSIGICQHALAESMDHLLSRTLYGKGVIEMPHIAFAAAQAYVRLAAMKLYAYRALDYVQSASADDRRYLLFTAVQKAKVSTEGVKVLALLSECINAKGFEADTYFEMALRDIQLIPGLEGSTHLNLSMASQFIPRYFTDANGDRATPGSCVLSENHCENPYLFEARTGLINNIAFAPFLAAYSPHRSIRNVRVFMRQAQSFRRLVIAFPELPATDLRVGLAFGHCIAIVAYAQLIAEDCALLEVPDAMTSAIFHLLIADLSAAAMNLASLCTDPKRRRMARSMIAIPKIIEEDWKYVADAAREI